MIFYRKNGQKTRKESVSGEGEEGEEEVQRES
jgi:hypothetical protein